MQTHLQVLSEDERSQIHERSLKVLATAGVRVDSTRGRQILKAAGGQVDENTRVVRFPRSLVEEALRLAPKNFSLGARRPNWDLQMNAGECTLLPDGEAISVIDHITGEQRPCTYQDWLDATLLTDALDEIGLYWSMVQSGWRSGSLPDLVASWSTIFRNFSKHVQLAITEEKSAPWLLEVLQAVFGDRETIRREHPISCLLCPQSPLVIDQQYTDAYLELLGWDIPAAAMPMPLMGGTAPGSMLSIIIQGNCETLALLCLIQAGAPGTPFIYAPVLAAMDPHTGLYRGGAIESGILGAATVEMARFYELPVEASGGGTDHFKPGIQAAYERALNACIPLLSWPDILVGPGLVGGSMILSFEQLLIDVEIFRMSVHAHRGILSTEDHWLDDLICEVGPAGNFLNQRSTVTALRSGEWYISKLGVHKTQRDWQQAGKPSLIDQARQKVDEILSTHHPLPLDSEIERRLEHIQARARE
ncbi:MAG: trimethylamine methyltransferase family protein [Anaerolineales bacterium]|nr:trimethylamine methyltransferase family protein [Anaerolineales bacterium]